MHQWFIAKSQKTVLLGIQASSQHSRTVLGLLGRRTTRRCDHPSVRPPVARRRRRRQAGSGPIGQWWRVPDGAQTGGSRQQTDGQEPAFIAVCSRLKSGRRTGADAERDATAGLRAGAEQDAAAGLRADAEQDADSRAACRHRQRGDGGMEDDADDNGQMDLTVIFCPLLSGSGAAGCGRARGGGAAGRRPAETAARSPVLLQLPPCPALKI